MLLRLALISLAASLSLARGFAGDDVRNPAPPETLVDQYLALMTSRAQAFRFSGPPDLPASLEATPLFRYDDLTRGYVDGAVWRLGKTGRPLAIVTTELHPQYLGSGPRVVYDYLSLSEVPFVATSGDFTWTPGGSAVSFGELPDAPPPAATDVLRMAQIKQMASRFSATQEVEGQKVQLRLLTKTIDRYTPADHARADGAAFLFVNGRNPGIVLFIESHGMTWTYGLGRLSLPSTLIVKLDDEVVWQQPPSATNVTNQSYTASNSAAVIPGSDP